MVLEKATLVERDGRRDQRLHKYLHSTGKTEDNTESRFSSGMNPPLPSRSPPKVLWKNLHRCQHSPQRRLSVLYNVVVSITKTRA
jgi:hypothetical protein